MIEILSPDDTYTDTQKRACDYQTMGIQTIWIIDPHQNRAHLHRQPLDGSHPPRSPGIPIHVDLDTLFASLQQPL